MSGRVLKDYPEISLKPEGLDGKVDFSIVFGRIGPVNIEIGSGRGTFLVNEAKAQPEVNFLGIERASRYYRYSVDRIGRWGLTNVRIIRTDASTFLAEYVGEYCVDCFHIYFPDPWPKKRHHKRRFLSETNLGHLIRTLRTGGEIRIATDYLEYFEQIRNLLAGRSDVLRVIEFFPTAGAGEGEFTGTNFERKYLKENREVFTIAVRKKGA